MGQGDREEMLKHVALFARANEKEFFKILASLEPKNVKMEVDQKLMYISIGDKKAPIPDDLTTFNEMDDVVTDEAQGDTMN